MIAPVSQEASETSRTHRRLRRARYFIASTLFKRRSQRTGGAKPISARRAWLFAAWVVVVTGIYFATMLGLL